ncbi:MAG: Rne/Rng family ribonuclease [Deltaproteobacteria bacterium]|nr:Rne/Rng family ribonuclease [Deltaproteobacteria bacterium]
MSKKMMVNATHPEENRVAIVEDGILTELDIEVAGREPTKGNIYKAVVVRVETGLQAAFVDYGAERLGFLQIDEINYTTVKPDYKPAEDGRRPRISDLLQRGQEFLVQITKEERGTKGAALTTYLSLAGRYMVLMPGSQTRGVSRKAESDSQRKELKKAMSSLDLADGVGYIVRTAALDQTREELERDYRYLIRLFESIKELEQKSKAPALIYKESNLMIRSIRDYFTTDMDEVLIDDSQVFKEAKDFFQMVMPDQVKLVKLHQERRPIFSRYQIEDQIETLSHNKVSLPSGGSIVIDPTEALVAIDVNSGKMASEKGVEATATKTNLEAAAEVGRQLRLRDLGGLIVIDFIDMRERKHNRQVEDQVKKSLENDKARVNVGRISKFGLLEMSRQRIKAALTEGSYLPCPHCNGSGHLKSPETQAVSLLRKIHASAAKGQVSRVDAKLPVEVATYLLNTKREELVDMERRYQLQIHIHGNRDFLADEVEIEIQKKEKEKTAQPEYVAVGTLPMVIEEESKEEKGKNEPTQQSESETVAEPAKKRRRRRRRKPAAVATPEEGSSTTESTEQAAEQTTSQSSTDTQEANKEAQSTDTAEAPVDTTIEQTDTAPPVKKPQRSRRSSNRTKTAAKGTETTETTADAASEEAPATIEKPEESPVTSGKPDEETADGQEAVATKPKRRRSSRKPKAADDKAQPDTTNKPVDQPATEGAATDKPTAETKPKQRRPRRPVKKADSAAEAPGTTQTTVAAEEVKPADAPTSQPAATTEEKPKRRRPSRAKPKAKDTETSTEAPAAQSVEEKPVKKAPARRSRKKSDDVPPAQETTPASEVAADKSQASQLATESTEKPKPRRASRAKPKTEEAAATETLSTEEKPAKKAPARRTSRKTPAKKATSTAKDDAVSPAKEKPSEGPSEEKVKPKRTRTVKKKPTEVEPASKD